MSASRHSKRAVSTITAAVACALLLPSSSFAEEELPVAAQAEASSDDYGSTVIKVNSAIRQDGTDMVTVLWSVTVEGTDDFYAGDLKAGPFDYTGSGSTGVTALDEANQIRFYTLRDQRGYCLCAGLYTPGDFVDPVNEGSSATFWNTFMIPQETEKITLEFPGFDPAKYVAIE